MMKKVQLNTIITSRAYGKPFVTLFYPGVQVIFHRDERFTPGWNSYPGMNILPRGGYLTPG
jgi:hypothetical protein